MKSPNKRRINNMEKNNDDNRIQRIKIRLLQVFECIFYDVFQFSKAE